MRAATRAWAFLVVSPAVLLLALWVVRRASVEPSEPVTWWDDDLRREVQHIVESRYVDAPDEETARRLFHRALEGYVGGLDPFSRFVPPEDRPQVERETQGQFGGVGVRVVASPAGLRVLAVREGGPAAKAGVEPGETIESVDGEPLAGRDREAMLVRLRGDPGTTVRLAVRGAAGLRPVDVERGVVPLDTVPAVRTIPGDPVVGYVRIEQFSEKTTAADVRDALARFAADGAGGLVIDLRRNLGGVVRSAVDVASLVLPPGLTVCVSRRREGGVVETTSAPPGAAPSVLPLVVLVDDTTASASEILAGALQDHGRAVVVGERTWGKFLVQTLVPTRRGDALVRLTTARYETPRGRSAPRDAENSPSGGLVPDVRVPPRSDAERETIRAAFERQTGPHWRTLPADAPEPPDAALDAAVALLRGGTPRGEPVRARAQ